MNEKTLLYQHTCSVCGKNVIFLDTEKWHTITATETIHNPDEHFFEPKRTIKVCDECWENKIKSWFS